MMGHTLFATTLSNYVHVIDQIVRLKTKGYRSGGNSTEVDNILDYRSSLSPLFNVWSVDKSESIDEPRKSAGLDDFELAQMKNFISSGSTTLTKVQANFVKGLLNSELDFHPSAVRLEISDQNKLYASKSFKRKCSFEQSDQFVLALNTLVEQRKLFKSRKIEDVQGVRFQDLFAKNFEVIVRTREQLVLLSQIGIGKNWVLEFSELDQINGNQQLKSLAETLLPEVELKTVAVPIANETSQSRIRTRSRARLSWKHSKNSADTWTIFCLSAIFSVPSTL
jgi:hypothetical protein